jgi:hypothetical protein
MLSVLLAVESSAEGDGVNVLPIAIVVLVVIVALVAWQRRR